MPDTEEIKAEKKNGFDWEIVPMVILLMALTFIVLYSFGAAIEFNEWKKQFHIETFNYKYGEVQTPDYKYKRSIQFWAKDTEYYK